MQKFRPMQKDRTLIPETKVWVKKKTGTKAKAGDPVKPEEIEGTPDTRKHPYWEGVSERVAKLTVQMSKLV